MKMQPTNPMTRPAIWRPFGLALLKMISRIVCTIAFASYMLWTVAAFPILIDRENRITPNTTIIIENWAIMKSTAVNYHPSLEN